MEASSPHSLYPGVCVCVCDTSIFRNHPHCSTLVLLPTPLLLPVKSSCSKSTIFLCQLTGLPSVLETLGSGICPVLSYFEPLVASRPNYKSPSPILPSRWFSITSFFDGCRWSPLGYVKALYERKLLLLSKGSWALRIHSRAEGCGESCWDSQCFSATSPQCFRFIDVCD